MISMSHRRLGRAPVVVLVVLLAALMLLAMADASEARRLPRHRWRANSDGATGAPVLAGTFACTFDTDAVGFFCTDSAGGTPVSLDGLERGGNAIPNQMGATPDEFTCTPDANAPPDVQVEHVGCSFTHAGHTIEFRLDAVAPYTDEEAPCAEPEPDVGQSCESMLPPHDHGVKVDRVVHSPVGQPSDTKNELVNRERVILHNFGATAVRIGRARLMQVPATGSPVERYQLPRGLALGAGKDLVIHTGRGDDRPGHLYIGRSGQLWRRTDHVLLVSRSGHHLTQCIYVGDAGAGIACGVAP